MARIPGIELDELYAKYELHPHLMDLYVEGEFDRDLLNHFLQERGLRTDVSVFTIDEVDVPNESLVKNKLNLGSNKHRLIALALLFEERLLNQTANVSCIVDADQDRVLQNTTTAKHLLYTDYSSMEMYCLNASTLRKFIVLACNLPVEKVEGFTALASAVLPTEFCVRALNDKFCLAAVTPNFASGLKDKRNLTSFDQQRYIQAFIEVNGLHKRAEELREAFTELYGSLPQELRNKSHGHDFVELLFEYASSSGAFMLQNKARDVTNYGGRLLASTLDTAQVFTEALFAKIEGAVRTQVLLWLPS